MVSALVLQLIQCCAGLPKSKESDTNEVRILLCNNSNLMSMQSSANSYSASYNCANNFLQSFLKNCSSRKSENDYRPILQNLTEDLLVTLNLPQWPATEMLLSILTKYLTRIVLKKTESSDVLRILR